MITVGIQENLRLLKAEKNDKGTLVVTIEQDAGGGQTAEDALNSTSSVATESNQDYFFWPVKADDRIDQNDNSMIATSLLNEFKALRARLNHILEQYMTSNSIKWNVTEGITFGPEGVTGAFADPAVRDTVVAKLYSNYADQFIKMITPHIGPNSPLFRVKLPRSSEQKNFSTLPKFPPFIEPMSVSSKVSKLAWSNYELGYRKGDQQGFPSGWSQANPNPVEGDAASGGGGSEEEAKTVSNLFGNK